MLGSGRQEGFLQQQAPNQPRDAEPWAHVDPSSVLMLTFGTIILFFGGMYLLSAEVYDVRSILMLVSMLLIYILVFAPWHRILPGAPVLPGPLHPAQVDLAQPQQLLHDMPVPRRPRAPLENTAY